MNQFRAICNCGWKRNWTDMRSEAEFDVKLHRAGLDRNEWFDRAQPCSFTRVVDRNGEWY